jgi:16S rRNA processing protein RimM
LSEQKLINVGKISGVFGIKGWLKVFSFTGERDGILDYTPWVLKKGSATSVFNVVEGSLQGKSVVVYLDGINDRDKAEAFIGCDIFISPEQLPKKTEGEYYWSDLIGLRVETNQAVQLGVVDSLLETGANDVLIVKGDRERAVPFLQGQTVINIDLQSGIIIVDWDPDF